PPGLDVGAAGRHGVERVRHGHDSSSQADLVSGQPVWVATSVVALVVLLDGRGPRTEEAGQGLDEASAVDGMAPDPLPLVVVQLARPTEHADGYIDLADVVKQGGPPQAVDVGRPEAQLRGDQLGVGANALAV